MKDTQSNLKVGHFTRDFSDAMSNAYSDDNLQILS